MEDKVAIYKVNGVNVDITGEDAQKLADAGENVWGFLKRVVLKRFRRIPRLSSRLRAGRYSR